MTNPEQEAYRQGRDAHRYGMAVEDCAIVDQRLRSWHHAGWHDADIESGARVYQGPERG